MATEIWELTESDDGTIYFEGVSDKYAAELKAAGSTTTVAEDGWFCMSFDDVSRTVNRERLAVEARQLGIGPNELLKYLGGTQ